jgi:hypothetical protein
VGGNGCAAVVGGFDTRQPEHHGGGKDADAHRDGQGQETGRHGHAARRARSILRTQIELEYGQGHQVRGVGQEGEEGALERRRIETEGTLEDDERQGKSDSEEPDSTHHEEQAKGPPAMRLEIACNRVAQGHGGAEHDQHRVEADSEFLRDVTHASTDPQHVQTRTADRESGQHVETPVPAMKGRCALSDLRDQLNRSAEDDEDGRQQMHGDGDIADGVARDVPMRHEPVPRLVVPSHGGTGIEGRDGEREHQLADDGRQEPEAGDGRQSAVGDGSRLGREPVGQDRGGHTLVLMGSS